MNRILSLCDYTGNWSQPYVEAGYDVVRVDLQHGGDVRLLQKDTSPVHGILAAPPHVPVLPVPALVGSAARLIWSKHCLSLMRASGWRGRTGQRFDGGRWKTPLESWYGTLANH